MVFAKNAKSAKIGLRYDHREFIHVSSNFHRVVQSAVTNEFNTVRTYLIPNVFAPIEVLYEMSSIKIFSYFSLYNFLSNKISLKSISLSQNLIISSK